MGAHRHLAQAGDHLFGGHLFLGLALAVAQIVGAEHDNHMADPGLGQNVAIKAAQPAVAPDVVQDAIAAETLTGFENETFLPGAWNPRREATRQAFNAWIRQSGEFDAVIDFDKALCDPEHPTRMLPAYDCGDHLHPSDLGYNKMGDAIDLALFE